ncbi:transcription factor DIVARICATA-like [Zingiber officinale]|uniref:Transcription factor MYBS1 n=1 Tax=Zingiber officinale TaxID=94328 RepID=A0AA50CBU4_ZINOF|nr:transcription factor DIVARICATA-like [Zingiber officinale]WLQ69483.1 MYB protein [Zingiber officinale]
MMAKSWMEVLPPASALCFPCTSCFLVEGRNWGGLSNGNWTREENKLFEKALAEFDKDTPDRWEKVAVYIPGKSTTDVERHYRDLLKDVSEIEAGRFHCPSYDSSSFALDWDSNCDFKAVKQLYSISRRKSGVHISGKKSGLHAAVQERKKGVPWTEEEHKLFLLGLKMYGKGDWRNISHNFVVTRTPTQVASHAQKYFIRLHSGSKDKRRASIHDITTANLPDNRPSSPSQSSSLRNPLSSTSTPMLPSSYSSILDINQPHQVIGFLGASMQMRRSLGGVSPYQMATEAHASPNGTFHDPMVHDNNLLHQMIPNHIHLHD